LTRFKSRNCISQTLAVIGPGQFGHLTGDTLLTKISHMELSERAS
jgi:hypothetical protein